MHILNYITCARVPAGNPHMHGGEHAYSTQKGPSWDYKQGPNCHEVTVLTPTLYQKASLCQRKRLEVKVRFRNEGRTLMT